jgi:Fe-S oxidoreductase
MTNILQSEKQAAIKLVRPSYQNAALSVGWVTAKKEVAVLLIQRDSMPHRRHKPPKSDEGIPPCPPVPEKVYYFGTCLIDLCYPQAGMAGIELLQREGIQVIYPQQQSCCGQARLQFRLPRRSPQSRPPAA